MTVSAPPPGGREVLVPLARGGNHRVGCAGCPGYEMSKPRSLAGVLRVSRCRFNEGVNIPEGIWGGIAALAAFIGPRRSIPRGVRGGPGQHDAL